VVLPLARHSKRRRYFLGEMVPLSRVYRCLSCEARIHWPKGLVFEVCPMCEVLEEPAGWVPERRRHRTEPVELKSLGLNLAALVNPSRS
jgi:hypothetical protein